MTTIRIDNGDIAVDTDTGQLYKITGIEEASQSVARHILSAYNRFFDEGNELINFSIGSSPQGMTDAITSQFLTEAVNRLIIKQQNVTLEGNIIQVNNVKTRVVGLTSLVFLVEVLYSDGQVINIVDQVKIRPTQLNQLINPNSILTI